MFDYVLQWFTASTVSINFLLWESFGKNFTVVAVVGMRAHISVYFKERQVVAISGALNYGASYNHMVVLGHEISHNILK